MNFLKALGQGIDNVWALLTLPLLLIAGFLVIMYIPLITAVIMWMFIWGQLVKADHLRKVANMISDNSAIHRAANTCVVNAFLLVIITVAVYVFFIYLTLGSEREMCKDYSSYIPGTLPALLQMVVNPIC